MKTIEIYGTLTFDEDLMYSDDDESQTWFENDLLLGSELHLHSNEIGDTIGTVRLIKLTESK